MSCHGRLKVWLVRSQTGWENKNNHTFNRSLSHVCYELWSLDITFLSDTLR
jgi:hypothetical protein